MILFAAIVIGLQVRVILEVAIRGEAPPIPRAAIAKELK